jgi:transposase
MDGVVAMDIIRDRGPISRLDMVDSGRRRRFSDEAKLAIVAESYRGPKQVSATARRHGITRFQLNSWRKAQKDGRLGAGSWEGFVPALVVPDARAPLEPSVPTAPV